MRVVGGGSEGGFGGLWIRRGEGGGRWSSCGVRPEGLVRW